jgi:hypothetical protein
MAGVGGGKYNFNQCTFTDYDSLYGGSERVAVVLMNNILNDSGRVMFSGDMKEANFGNCIIFGNTALELVLIPDNIHQFNFLFDHCLIKDQEKVLLQSLDQSKFIVPYLSSVNNPGFVSTQEYHYNFQLTKNSLAVDRGNPDIAAQYPMDYLNRSRMNDFGPDMGAYEYYPTDATQ